MDATTPSAPLDRRELLVQVAFATARPTLGEPLTPPPGGSLRWSLLRGWLEDATEAPFSASAQTTA